MWWKVKGEPKQSSEANIPADGYLKEAQAWAKASKLSANSEVIG